MSTELEQLFQRGAYSELEAKAAALIAVNPRDGMANLALGLACYFTGRYQAAAQQFRLSLEDAPLASTWSNLGATYRVLGELASATAAHRQALKLEPDNRRYWGNLANVLLDLQDYVEAEAAVRRALATGKDPKHYFILGTVLFRQGRIAEARHAFEAGLAIREDAGLYQGCGTALMYLGQFRAGEACYRKSVALEPQNWAAWSSYLFNLNYMPHLDVPHAMRTLHAYNSAFAPVEPAPYDNAPLPERPLRVGYLSPDFCSHVVAGFMLPIFENHDRSRYEITAYAEVRHEDEVSARFKACCRWVPTVALNDRALAARMRADGIDVLVDISGHSAGNRLPVFKLRPAPVQLTYMIGQGTGSGLDCIDGFIADELMLPPLENLLLLEPPIRLPRVPLVFRAPTEMPAVTPLPALARRQVTFGHYGRSVRVNDEVIALWSRVLAAVPGSRLILDNGPFGDPASAALVRERFAGAGVAAERLVLRCSRPQTALWAAYGEIDIALDPFPQNAGTTTMEALWMGVPVVTLAHRPPVGRFGASLLTTVGLADWIAHSLDEYVTIAQAKAADLAGLARLRIRLREMVAQSPLCDGVGLTRALEGAYRDAWQRWCARQA